jgi:hypothetical protein
MGLVCPGGWLRGGLGVLERGWNGAESVEWELRHAT